MTTTPNREDPDEGDQKKSAPIDLSELQNLTLGPAWEDSGPQSRTGDRKSKAPTAETGRVAPRRDRRPTHPGRGFPRGDRSPGSEREKRPERRGADAGRRLDSPRDRTERREAPPFRPTVEVAIYPEEAPFKILAKAMRASCRTYELFDITRLILDKHDRIVAVIRPWGGRTRESAVSTHLFLSVPDGIPFETQEEAVEHVLSVCLGHFFETEEAEVDPPSGHFPMVNRCTVTGELLGPPNYHRYQEFLQEHYARRIGNMSFERFQQKIETVRDEALVGEWLEKMKKVTRFKLKRDDASAEEVVFDSLDAARRYLLSHRKNDVVQEVESVRLEGKKLDALPAGNIRRSIETYLEQQRRFPLETANHIRGRLRRLKFHLYKKGSRGVSYVCAVKRKFRDPDIPLADSADRLIRFIEEHPSIPAPELPASYLGMEKLPPAPDTGEAEKPTPRLAYPDTPELRRLNQDLRWLISEGYVTEYADGRLFAPPVQGQAKQKSARVSEPKTDTVRPAGNADVKETPGESETGPSSPNADIPPPSEPDEQASEAVVSDLADRESEKAKRMEGDPTAMETDRDVRGGTAKNQDPPASAEPAPENP